jgi:hypothetical protein
MRKLFMVSVGIGLVLTAGPALAHHSFAAEYEAKKPVTFAHATITRVEWVNPHSWIHVDVKKDDGSIEKWMIEGNTPNTLARRGISRDTLKVGTVISITGYQAKDGSLRASGRDLTYPDGRKVLMASTGAGAPPDAPEK